MSLVTGVIFVVTQFVALFLIKGSSMKKWKVLLAIGLGVIVVACGGGGGGATGGSGTPADFSGTWSGTYNGTAAVYSIVQTGSNFNMTRTSPSSAGITYTGAVNGNSALVTTYINGTSAATSTLALTNDTTATMIVNTCTPPQGSSCAAPGSSITLTRAAASGTLVGIVKNLRNSGLVISNGNITVTVNASSQVVTPQADVSYSFAGPMAVGNSYNVTVQTQPVGQTCTIPNGSGTVQAGVSNTVTVFCDSPIPSNRFSSVGSYPITDCVQDNYTGLTWEGKPYTGRRANQGLTNYDSTTKYQVQHLWTGPPYVAPTQTQIDSITNSVGYKNEVNSSQLCGYNNWRMPTADEMLNLPNHGVDSVTIDSAWFPNAGCWYWTSSPNLNGNDDFAGWVNLVDGIYGEGHRFEAACVRLVR
jgi:hypothetical protein